MLSMILMMLITGLILAPRSSCSLSWRLDGNTCDQCCFEPEATR
jgi:hypothetical protein